MKLLLLLAALSLLTPPPALAGDTGYRTPGTWDHGRKDDDDHDNDDREDHERARDAVMRGNALPLSRILRDAEAQGLGRLLEADLEDHHGRLIYELKMLDPRGQVTELRYDAATGALLRRHGRD
ncbi:PepSY domain-containing protein [Pararhodospirillum photometricum]|uniref:Peptidase propeptide and YPEB domain protein,putative n=1 Tax=Pararhodospirillum photometricum DSM 122 TaxID=1150469 RepID=H6SL42_PARPM|nr:peptidase [Pararhodospirillum photometricum]CCG08707.1 Peptidase propeptide and YPEB domain protein,putative [Pararhodospirillum photometricum DSM 122]